MIGLPFLLAYVIVLSALSFFVFFEGASNEPYVSFRQYDAISQVGGGITLMVLWFQLAIGLLFGVNRKIISPKWLLILIWIAIVIFYLRLNTIEYVQDITQFVTN